MIIVPVESCPSTKYFGRNVYEQWVFTPVDTKPSGDGWRNPIETTKAINGVAIPIWLWKRDINRYDTVELRPSTDAGAQWAQGRE